MNNVSNGYRGCALNKTIVPVSINLQVLNLQVLNFDEKGCTLQNTERV